MAKNEVPKGEPFDLEKLQTLFEMMEKHGLTEVNLKRGEETWKLRRGPQETVSMVPAPMQHAVPAPVAAPAAAPAPPTEAAPAADAGPVIKSPTVGTFYASPSPDDPPFVSVGSKVGSDTIVCIVEAMKVFNQIPAEMNGTITEILVKDGEAVEFGQPLFRISQG